MTARLNPEGTYPEDDRPVMLSTYGPDGGGLHPWVYKARSDQFGRAHGQWRPIRHADTDEMLFMRYHIAGWRECTPEERAEADRVRNNEGEDLDDDISRLRRALDDYMHKE